MVAYDSVRGREMERVPSDDPEAEVRGDGVLEHLCHSLQLLASPAQAQLSHFPAGWVVLTDEMVLDFDHWAHCVATYWKLSPVQTVQLSRLDDFLSEMSGSLHRDFWTDEALLSDARWEQVRTLAKATLIEFGWPIEIPPVAREEYGMLVDKGSCFLKNHPPF
jgi:hypothetical protein